MGMIRLFGVLIVLGAVLFAGCEGQRSPAPPPAPPVQEEATLNQPPTPPTESRVASVENLPALHEVSKQIVQDILSVGWHCSSEGPCRLFLDIPAFQETGDGSLQVSPVLKKIRVQLNEAADGRLYFMDSRFYEVWQLEKRLGENENETFPPKNVYQVTGNIERLSSGAANPRPTESFRLKMEVREFGKDEIKWEGEYRFKTSHLSPLFFH